MAQAGTNWRRFSLRALFFLTFTAAVFLAGYRLGLSAGRGDFAGLIKLIKNTTAPESWNVEPADPFSSGADPFSSDAAVPVSSDAADPCR
jgi:hypothetical protein